MNLEYDENKRQTIWRKRGVDLLYAARIFHGAVVSSPDRREDYKEQRTISIGMVDNECFVVVHADRGSAIRLITTWKGGRKDRKRYEESIARRNRADE
jgi:hypothetical protein